MISKDSGTNSMFGSSAERGLSRNPLTGEHTWSLTAKNPGGNYTERFAMEGQPPETQNVFEKKDTENKGEEPTSEADSGRYRWYNHMSPQICNDCGVLVADTVAHDNFHLMVEQR